MNNISFILFGGTGDLTKKKLAKAISLVSEKEKIKINLTSIGRKDFNDETYKKFLGVKFHKNVKIKYFKADFSKKESFSSLEQQIKNFEDNKTIGRIFYLATSYDYFETISEIIKQITHESGFTRIMFEKPFGESLESFKKLDKSIKKNFKEEQIFRVDHYLAKETVDSILLMRFSNPLFENVWNSKFVDKIKIIVKEDEGVKERIEYYEKAGAIKDMIQSHLLQILTFILMDAPKTIEEKHILKEKIIALKKIRFKGKLQTGQYENYKEEAKKQSNTETFAEVHLESRSKRWKGTEIILLTGKNINEKQAHITLEFKKEPCILYCNFDSAPNKLVFWIQPKQNVELTMNAKIPGENPKIDKVRMSFNPESKFQGNNAEGYEIIISECLKGNKSIFLSSEILKESWKITDKIIKKSKSMYPVIYKKGTEGPKWNSNK